MRIIRPFLTATSLTVAMLAVSAGVVTAAAAERTKGEVSVTVTNDPPLPNGSYTLSVNASGDGTKSGGGFSLFREGTFVAGRTALYCTDETTTTIFNEINPPKKNSLDLTGYYLIISVEDDDLSTATIDLVSGGIPTSCP